MLSTPIRRLCHWGPISVLGIIKLITWAMVHFLGIWWPPHASVGGAINAVIFLAFAAATLYYFLQSLLEGPGFVPVGWKPENEGDIEYLQFCTICNSYKAPRSHHCKKCGHCILKMDHHCPWINCCVGQANHCYFTTFLICAVIGCSIASVELSICMYYAITRTRFSPGGARLLMPLGTLLLTLLAIGMAVGVVLAVGALLYFQVSGILRNRTTIEEWIVEKAAARRVEQGLPPFVFPYDMGWRQNLQAVLRPSHTMYWPVRPDCGQYDLTREQQAQKLDKRLRSRLYRITEPYSGWWVPLFRYPKAAVNVPCTDEHRLVLTPGDVVRVTRQRRHWLFGERVIEGGGERGPRGWFPRAAAELAHAHAA
ncbi:unnamed protein product [Diatraea saccharalis]|uniref:Palmitoyltransferase n=1 Tax=Diatraea saccharalis TaxID=40085 RepID=A0A9N9RF87_9NEOP|nr:unnamed protein product [Diatraea saccharalis]